MKNVDDLLPLTPVQRLMLLHERGASGNALANQVAFDLTGTLDEEALREAVDALVVRHPALRTAIVDDARLERPLQIVRRTVPSAFERIDLTGVDPEEQGRRLERIGRDDAARRFRLERPPLMRCTLIRLGSGRHRLLWTLHHLVVDRWSFTVLFRDLAALYGQRLGEPAALPDPVPFRHYVAWLQQRDPEDSDAFWRSELAAVERPTRLAVPRAERGPRTVTHRRVDASAMERIEDAARRCRTGPATLVLGAVALESARRAHTDHPLVGVTVSGRPPEVEGVEEIVGSFVNAVPACVPVSGSIPVGEWLTSLHRGGARRRAHEHVGLDRILDDGGFGGGPWFDLLTVLNLDPAPSPAWPGLEFSFVGATLDAGFPLVLQAAREGDGLVFSLVHDQDAVDAAGFLDGVVEILTALAGAERGARLDAVVEVPMVSSETVPGPGRSTPAPPPSVHGTRGEAVRAIWRETLGVDRAAREDDFFALGGSSLQAARLLARLESVADRPVPMAALLTGRTLGALLDAVVPDEAQPATGPLLALRDIGSAPPLVGVPGLRGNLILFMPLVEHLAPGRPVFGLQSRGTDREEDRPESMEAIAADFVEQLGDLVHGPFHLFGLCWGAAAAFEMTAQLVARGRPPRSLSLLDPAVLLGQGSHARAAESGVVRGFVQDRVRLYWDELRSRGWRDRGRFVAEKVGRLAAMVGSPSDETVLKAELRERAVMAANLQALERYDPPRVEVAARLFLSEDFDPGGRPDPRRDWIAHFEAPPSIASVPGFDSGDAMTRHTAGVAAALDAWISLRDQAE